MQILRIPPFPLSVTYTVPEPNTGYIFTIEDSPESIEVEEVIFSNSSSQLTFELSGDFSKYDHDYAVIVYENNGGSRGDVVVQDNLSIVKPYVNPYKMALDYGDGTASEIKSYIRYEQLARNLIDSVVGAGTFIFDKTEMEVVGEGTDYLPLWDRIYKILKVYENGELVFDSEQDPPHLGDFMYGITEDKTAIYKEFIPPLKNFNRSERRPMKLPVGNSDSYRASIPIDSDRQFLPDQPVLFPEGWDYIVIYEAGYKVIPHDIQEACEMLVEDIKCGKLDYMQKYITSYNTDQFTIKFDAGVLSGTGNALVDKILDKYITSIGQPRII